MYWLETSSLAHSVILACLLFFIVRRFVALAAPKAGLPLALAALGPAISAVALVAGRYVFEMLGNTGWLVIDLVVVVLLWAGLALGAFATISAAKLDLGAMKDRFPMETLMIGGGLAVGILNVVTGFLRFRPFPGVILETAGAIVTVVGLFRFMDRAWPSRGTLPVIARRYQAPDRGALFAPGFIGFFVVGYLLLAIFSPRDMMFQESRVANLACTGALLVAWGVYITRYVPFIWVLDRRPEAIVWVFIRETRVIRGAARWTVWATNIGVDSGQFLLLQTGGSQQDAQDLTVSIASMCPTAARGYDESLRKQFSSNPDSLRRAA